MKKILRSVVMLAPFIVVLVVVAVLNVGCAGFVQKQVGSNGSYTRSFGVTIPLLLDPNTQPAPQPSRVTRTIQSSEPGYAYSGTYKRPYGGYNEGYDQPPPPRSEPSPDNSAQLMVPRSREYVHNVEVSDYSYSFSRDGSVTIETVVEEYPSQTWVEYNGGSTYSDLGGQTFWEWRDVGGRRVAMHIQRPRCLEFTGRVMVRHPYEGHWGCYGFSQAPHYDRGGQFVGGRGGNQGGRGGYGRR